MQRLNKIQDKVPDPEKVKRQAEFMADAFIEMENTVPSMDGKRFTMTPKERSAFVNRQIKLIETKNNE